MLFEKKKLGVHSENLTNFTRIVHGQNAELFNAKAGGALLSVF
jgi:hypothetical protein